MMSVNNVINNKCLSCLGAVLAHELGGRGRRDDGKGLHPWCARIFLGQVGGGGRPSAYDVVLAHELGGAIMGAGAM